jgi:SAM-dependent methyltransferase
VNKRAPRAHSSKRTEHTETGCKLFPYAGAMKIVCPGIVMFALVYAAAQAPSTQTDRDKKNRATYEGAYDPAEAPRFNRQPNSFLLECIKNRKPGRALDVGMGNGRNAIALAQHGWQVTGFDIAEAGVDQAKRQAAQLGLSIATFVQSDQEFDFGSDRWDLVVLTYQPFRDILGRVKASLKEGGIVVIENFQRDTRRYRLIGAGGILGNNEALQLFSDFRILRYEDVEAKPDWGIEFPVNRLIRLLAQKGDPRLPGCDWKGSPRTEGEEVTWGSMRLRCTATGWQAVTRKP